ncbi:hypothetical protein [Tropicimonas marinistellae]|uniref:hypothetical protein n=1 Tax=Tropicimonas marinistellae TaxID=1739787 RepID=UPI000836AF32|nr:hypothetical protein [Tropicimonas marinistellae]
MTTKAEYEAELQKLRRILTEAREAVPASMEEDEATSADERPEPDEDSKNAETAPDDGTSIDWALSQIDSSELEGLLAKFSEEVKDLHEHKPILTVFGAFLLGYALGRAR